ncbi:unnamed protein product [Lactuca virosa]|uniref:Uncharacterized protein n=1 Tax=Lactuca virosa TaxID=75947 RepID=A0AAU9P2Q7_9ASTR|nr:unnamed protein product [Lactuca virosa]
MKSAMSRSILMNPASSSILRRGYTSECAPERKVAVLGAAGDVRLSAMSTPDLRVPICRIVVGYTAIAKYCPHALVHMISNPVNSSVPIASEVMLVLQFCHCFLRLHLKQIVYHMKRSLLLQYEHKMVEQKL